MPRIFAGYCTADGLRHVTKSQAQRLTHLLIAFAQVKDGQLDDSQLKANIREIERIRACNPELPILISLGGGDIAQHLEFSAACAAPDGIARLAESACDMVRSYELDGVDCDWEFPGWSDSVNKMLANLEDVISLIKETQLKGPNMGVAFPGWDKVEEKVWFTALLKKIHKGLDAYAHERGQRCWLTIAAGCYEDYIRFTELDKLMETVDFINVMTYDFRSYSGQTNFHSNPCPPDAEDTVSAEWAMELFHNAGVPYEKLVLGAAFYSHIYPGVVGGGDGLYRPYTGMYAYGPNYDELSKNYQEKDGYIRYWHENAKTPWLFNGTDFITYEDETSIAAKVELAVQKGLGGLFYWEHSADTTGTLFDAIYSNLEKAGETHGK